MSQGKGRDLRIVVIGAGMAGILAAIKLREAVSTIDLVVIEGYDGPQP